LSPAQRVLDVGGEGIRFAEPFSGSLDMSVAGRRVWSFSSERPVELVAWPKNMRRFLTGWADLVLESDGNELFAARVAFDDEDREIRFEDVKGRPVIVDKWGFIQRTFDSRPPEVRTALADSAAEILEVIRRSHGVEGWMSFGTLLGAARSGQAIGHDSDVDLCYLSAKETPAEMTIELWDLARALRAAGMEVVHKTGSFITVEVPTPDGIGNGIDLYTTFILDGLLYETATVRAHVPVSAILPLTTLEFEGRRLPAPADPDALLKVSYGPNWKTPDPSFKHRPGHDIVSRFDGWFGSLWSSRRDWRAYNANQLKGDRTPSEFASWVSDRLAPGTRVIDVGCGCAGDVDHFARSGFPVLGLDYALPNRRIPQPRRARRALLNLYDERDVLTRGALLARFPDTQAIYARELLECLAPEARDRFWRLASMTLRRGGRLYVEGLAQSRASAADWTKSHGGGRLRRLSPHTVVTEAQAHGARIVESVGVPEGRSREYGGEPARWRLVVEWTPGERTVSA
jgi:hypothetical protein